MYIYISNMNIYIYIYIYIYIHMELYMVYCQMAAVIPALPLPVAIKYDNYGISSRNGDCQNNSSCITTLSRHATASGRD